MNTENTTTDSPRDLESAIGENKSSFTLFQDKRVVIVAAVIVFFAMIIAIIIAFSGNQSAVGPSNTTTPGSVPTGNEAPPTPTPTMTAELKEAVTNARRAAQEYDQWQDEVRTEYQWLRKLPLANEKYFVFFDLDQNKFIGEIHYTPGDNVQALQDEAIRKLRDEKQIPVDDFPIEWEIDQ